MNRLLNVGCAWLFGWAGWWLGGRENLTLAFFLSVVGVVLGLYVARWLAHRLVQ